jgi:hypothetical protein
MGYKQSKVNYSAKEYVRHEGRRVRHALPLIKLETPSIGGPHEPVPQLSQGAGNHTSINDRVLNWNGFQPTSVSNVATLVYIGANI